MSQPYIRGPHCSRIRRELHFHLNNCGKGPRKSDEWPPNGAQPLRSAFGRFLPGVTTMRAQCRAKRVASRAMMSPRLRPARLTCVPLGSLSARTRAATARLGGSGNRVACVADQSVDQRLIVCFADGAHCQCGRRRAIILRRWTRRMIEQSNHDRVSQLSERSRKPRDTIGLIQDSRDCVEELGPDIRCPVAAYFVMESASCPH